MAHYTCKNARINLTEQRIQLLNNKFINEFLGVRLDGGGGGGGALGYFLGGYVPPGSPNWQPILKKNSPKIDTPL